MHGAFAPHAPRTSALLRRRIARATRLRGAERRTSCFFAPAEQPRLHPLPEATRGDEAGEVPTRAHRRTQAAHIADVPEHSAPQLIWKLRHCLGPVTDVSNLIG